MRKIKFRGKDAFSGQWRYGAYIPTDFTQWREPSIFDGHHRAEVDGETLGQYTGNHDADGNEIYEGDILESRASVDKRDWKKWIVYFLDGAFEAGKVAQEHRKRSQNETTVVCEDEIKFYGFCVIGNIHDNPELMEERK